jgi:hypothetical protein
MLTMIKVQNERGNYSKSMQKSYGSKTLHITQKDLYTRYVQKVCGLLLSFFIWLIKTTLFDMNRRVSLFLKVSFTFIINLYFLH